MVKILILGGPGSGKSTYAHKLAKRLCLPVFNLDDIFWQTENVKPFSQKRSEQERVALITHILSQNESWIIEGVYTKEWVEPIYTEATHILYLNTNKWLSQIRIIKRYLKNALRQETRSQNGSFYALIQLLKWNHFQEKNRRIHLEERLKKTRKKCRFIR